METVSVKGLVNEIKTGLTQKSCSMKDEVRVMQAMLNDKEFAAGIYGNNGKIGEYSPYEDSRRMLSSVIASATKINKDEAAALANAHEFTKGEATSMVNISKEFINVYSDTGRKISLGGRETSNIYLIPQEKEESICRYPTKIGTNPDGSQVTGITEKTVPAHKSMRAKASCPNWVK